jgi:dTDP-4-amino-4,6-dideoxygalactose transaminase
MKTLAEYTNPFQAILEFETAVAKFTGAPYCITTDCCTHAIEIAFRLGHKGSPVRFPGKTYLSVPMTMHKLGIAYELTDESWYGSYQFEGSNIWDCARRFESSMYQAGTIQCVSFGMSKPLEIGLGGCILTDDPDLYKQASCMRYDGRDIFNYSPWATQTSFRVGYHYYLRPEECVVGLNLLEQKKFTKQLDKHFDYPNCKNIIIHN